MSNRAEGNAEVTVQRVEREAGGTYLAPTSAGAGEHTDERGRERPMTPMSAMPMMAGAPANPGAMPMMMPMMMPMTGAMPMGGMQSMPMGGGMMPMGGMPGMPMMGGMMMPMMAMPMMCRMIVEMTQDGMVCKMMPMDASAMEMLAERCNAMNAMMTMGMPCMMSCGGMPLMMATR
jgi:hypothetical protein